MHLQEICFISENLTWGGSEELWSLTALACLKEGFKVRFFVLPQLIKHERISEIVAGGGHLVTIRHSPKPLYRRFSDKVIPQSFHYKTYNNYYSELLDEIPSLVVISLGHPFACTHWMEECRKRSIPYVIINQLVPETTWPDDAFSKKILSGYQSARAAYFVSRNNIELLCKVLGSDLPNAEVVSNPFQVNYDIPFQYPGPQDGFYNFALVGRLDAHHKGHDILLEVIQDSKWKSRNIRFNFFGSGDNKEALERLVRRWDIKNVTIAGHTGNIQEMWSSHHALVLPSRVEGLPLAVVEAMLSGRFCIVTAVGGNSEIIDNDLNGFIAKAATAEFFDDAMERAWKRKDEWEMLGKKAAAKIKMVIPESPVGEFLKKLKQLV